MQDFAEYPFCCIGFSLRTLQRFFAHPPVKAFDRRSRRRAAEFAEKSKIESLAILVR